MQQCDGTLFASSDEGCNGCWHEGRIQRQRRAKSQHHQTSAWLGSSPPLSINTHQALNGTFYSPLPRRRRFLAAGVLLLLAGAALTAAASNQQQDGEGIARLGPSLRRGLPRRRQPGQHARDVTFFRPVKGNNQTASHLAQRSASAAIVDGASAGANNAILPRPVRKLLRRRLAKSNEINADRIGNHLIQDVNSTIRAIRRQRLDLRQKSAKAGGLRFPAYKFATHSANDTTTKDEDVLDDADTAVDSPASAAAASILNTLDVDEDVQHGPPAFLTRIRRDKDGVSPPTTEAPSLMMQVTPDTASTSASTAKNESSSHSSGDESSSTVSTAAGSNNDTVSSSTPGGQDGGHDGHHRAVVLDGEADNSTGEGGTYTSLDSPPEKVRIANIGPFSFQLRWQKLARDPGQPVTFIAELTYVETPGCSGDECAGNFTSVANPQVITKENSTFQDQQWMIGKNRRVEQGAVRPYSKYKVKLKRKTGDVEGQFSPEVEVFTSASVPDRPQNVTLASLKGEIHATWGNPKLYPGPMNYSIHVLLWDGCPDIPNVQCDCKKTKAGNDKIVLQVTADEQTKRSKVLGKSQCILNGSSYMVQVQAATTAGAGPLSLPQNITTDADHISDAIGSAPVDGSRSAAHMIAVTVAATDAPTAVNNLTATCGPSHMRLRWDPPEATHGLLAAYEIRVQKLRSDLVDGSDQEPTLVFGPVLLNLSASCQMPSPSPGEPEYHRGSPCTPQEYTVPDGLESGFSYEAIVVAVAENGSKGPSSRSTCSSDDKTAEHLEDPSNGALIGGIIGGILAVVILCAAAFFVWRRVAAPYARAKPTQPARPSVFSNDKEIHVKGHDNLAHEVDDIFEIKRKLESDEVKDEFDLICSQGPKLDANERAFARTSLSKNRFVNVLPFERTRVRLVGMDSDYINASYVKGENHEREYIATQAPKLETIRDFWSMVWQEEVATIAMIAQGTKGLTEDQLPPGFQYWPKLEVPMKFDSLTVYKMEDNSMRTGSGRHTVRIFVLEKGTESRSVTQVQFEEWPTVGVPEDTRQLNDYVVAVRQQNDYHVKASGQKPPLLVHCSAGTGRTGVIIALDRLRHQYKHKKAVDIPGTVHDLRHCRVHLVQTPEQYAFLYRCAIQMMEDVNNPPLNHD